MAEGHTLIYVLYDQGDTLVYGLYDQGDTLVYVLYDQGDTLVYGLYDWGGGGMVFPGKLPTEPQPTRPDGIHIIWSFLCGKL